MNIEEIKMCVEIRKNCPQELIDFVEKVILYYWSICKNDDSNKEMPLAHSKQEKLDKLREKDGIHPLTLNYIFELTDHFSYTLYNKKYTILKNDLTLEAIALLAMYGGQDSSSVVKEIARDILKFGFFCNNTTYKTTVTI
jgi:hypothetical protein